VLRPGDLLDQFEILRPLGQGAYTLTWLARDTQTGEQVAIKRISPRSENDPAAAARLRREATISRRLTHPGIQHAARSAAPANGDYIALEYVEGQSLRDWLNEHGRASILEAIEIVGLLASALSYAHGRGVVHRDVKPENVVMLPDGSLKIIDFGSALLEGSPRLGRQASGEAGGTPDYMAPEQIEGKRGDRRTDIYALGILLYELLAGRVPFQGDNANAVMYQQVHSEPDPISASRPDVPPDLEAVAALALRKAPDERYQSADDMLAGIGRLEGADGAPNNHIRAGQWQTRLAKRLNGRSET